MSEILTLRTITPLKQSFEMGCVPAAISMVFSGFGIESNDKTLVEKYFPSAKLPAGTSGAGVETTTAVAGLVQALHDLDLQTSLQIDVLLPFIWEYTDSDLDKWIVRCRLSTVRKSAKKYKKGSLGNDIVVLAEMTRREEIGIYSVNSKMMKRHRYEAIYAEGRYTYDERTINQAFSEELVDFVRRGHLIGIHESLLGHARAIDGTRTRDEGFWIVDPQGEKSSESYNGLLERSSLIRAHYHGNFSDGMFDYLIRISPREDLLNPQQHGFRSFLQRLKSLIP